MVMRITVDPDSRFRDRLRAAAAACDDLTVPMGLIANSWLKTNRAIFAVAGPGKYVDLTERYKERKKAKHGFEYPILRATGRLERSITTKGSKDNIGKILNKNMLILGSKVPYGAAHQLGAPSRGLPSRPWVLLGTEQTAPDKLNVRVESWIRIIEDHVVKMLDQKVHG